MIGRIRVTPDALQIPPMRSRMSRSIAVCILLVSLIGSTQAAFIAQSTNPSGGLFYEGFGDIGGGVGSGRYTLGTCVASLTSTTCTVSGSYVETPLSNHSPGGTGTFTLRLVYPGMGPSPVVARSETAGSHVLRFTSLGAAQFILDVFPASGGTFTGVFPAPVAADSINFSNFLDGNTVSCTGAPAQCTIGQVGLVAGATIRGATSSTTFEIPGNFSNSAPTVEVVEFYNAVLDHYFITWVPAEIANLDAGNTPTRWTRTGQTFRIYTSPQGGNSPVCRYYIPPAKGDSHFFGRGKAECDATGANNPSFVLEATDFMFAYLPGVGTCPIRSRPVYRVFSNRPDANHRYMVDTAVRDQMVGRGWLAEGDGPNLVVMCAPL
jgi:hypothetical protein